MTTPMSLRLVALVVLAAPLLVACTSDGDTGAELGAIVSLREGSVDSTDRTLQLPDRQVVVQAEDLGADVAAKLTNSGTDRPAGDGMRWIGIDWRSIGGAGIPSWLSTLAQQVDGEKETDTLDATLVVGDERIALGSPTSDAVTVDGANTLPRFAVAVPATGSLVLEVDFSGVIQTLDLATGAQESRTADAIAGLPETQPTGTPCGGQWTLDGAATLNVVRVDCCLVVVSLSYVAGLGWAEDPARPWVVLFATADLPGSVRDAGVTYEVGDARDATYLDGQPPALKDLEQAQAGGWSVISVYAPSSPGDLVLSGRVELSRQSGDGPDSLQVTVTDPASTTVPPPGF